MNKKTQNLYFKNYDIMLNILQIETGIESKSQE